MKSRIHTFRVPYDAALEAASKRFISGTYEIDIDPLHVTLPDGAYKSSFDEPLVQISGGYVRDSSGNQVTTLMLCERQRPSAHFWGMCCNYYRVYQDENGEICFVATQDPCYKSFISAHFIKE